MSFDFSPKLRELAAKAEEHAALRFQAIEQVSLENTSRVLAAFAGHRVSDTYFRETTGYGYDDQGRDKLEEIYAQVFGCESALVRTGFVNGSHAIACGMFACVSTGDVMLSLTGNVYDTLQTVTGQHGKVGGSFADYGIGFEMVDMKNALPDYEEVERRAADPRVKAVFIQRSRGYSIRHTLSIPEIERLCGIVRRVNPGAYIMVDNCYGEFCDTREPTHVGSDLICGSLIKNPGGGLAPMGGYIAGKKELVERAANRLTLPGIGAECGATLGANRSLYQGFFMAPHTVAQALKTAAFCTSLMGLLGYEVTPGDDRPGLDIIHTINFGSREKLLAFCRGVQAGSPVDAFVTPEAWDMPGYDDQVVMAAGTFIQGASIELSCDGPMRPPFTAFIQGGLTYESGKLGIMTAVQSLLDSQAGK